MERICILVQEYNKPEMSDYVFCKVIKSSGSLRNFPLSKNYVSKFSTKLKMGKAYIIDYAQTPSKCGKYTNHSVGAIYAELSEQQLMNILLGF